MDSGQFGHAGRFKKGRENMLDTRLKNFTAIFVFSCLSTAACSAQKMNVKIIQRQNNATEYSYDESSKHVALNTGPIGDDSVIPLSKVTYKVIGATFSLLLPDGRIAVVNCTSKADKQSFDRSHALRNCRMPMPQVTDISVLFKRNTAKLFWLTSIDGKTFDSETYQILGVLDK